MKIAYLMNTYPVVSGTFIRREIQTLETQGIEVMRYSIRRWSGQLVDPQDKAEQARTHYVLTGRIPALIGLFFVELVTNPVGLARATGAWLRLLRNAGGGFIRHSAYLLEAISIRRRAAKDGVQCLHTHFATNSAAVALLTQRLGGPQYSFTAHGQEEFDNSKQTSVADKVAGARFVVAISHFCRVQLARGAGMSQWDKLHVVRCGVDTREFDVSGASFDGNFTFVCVGRLCLEKAQTLIVEATARVALTHPEVRVLLIGDGDTRRDIEATIARLSVQREVTLLGWRTNAEVRKTLGAARALLLPSFAEGLPVAIMEAQALARPVISTFIAGIPELVDQSCGWIVPAGSVDAIARAMKAALETPSPKLEEMGREGRRRVTELHDVNRNTAELRDLFIRAAAHSGRSPLAAQVAVPLPGESSVIRG